MDDYVECLSCGVHETGASESNIQSQVDGAHLANVLYLFPKLTLHCLAIIQACNSAGASVSDEDVNPDADFSEGDGSVKAGVAGSVLVTTSLVMLAFMNCWTA